MYNKKSIATHITLLIVISVVMTVFLFFTMDYFFRPDHENCQIFDFEIGSQCKEGNIVKFNLKNNGDTSIYYDVNGKSGITNVILAKESKQIRALTQGENIVFMPVVRENGESLSCRGRKTVINPEVLLKC
jgi:hypothetical protein